MTITIYDYNDKKTEVVLPDKEILRIIVTIFSGDETGIVEFEDRSMVRFDASNTRFQHYYDGEYVVEGDNIAKWINFVPSDEYAVSYQRQDMFCL